MTLKLLIYSNVSHFIYRFLNILYMISLEHIHVEALHNCIWPDIDSRYQTQHFTLDSALLETVFIGFNACDRFFALNVYNGTMLVSFRNHS